MLGKLFEKGSKVKLPKPPVVLIDTMGPNPPPVVIYHPTPKPRSGGGSGKPPIGPIVTMKYPPMEPNSFSGPSLLEVVANWLFSVPPVIKVEVEAAPVLPQVDSSRCLAMLLKLLAGVAKDFFDSEKARLDARKTAELREDTPVYAETRNQSESTALRSAQDALNDFRACLQKGMSQEDALCKLFEDEAKSLCDSTVKTIIQPGSDLGKVFGGLDVFKKQIVATEKKFNSETDRINLENRANVVVLLKDIESWNDDMRSFFANVKKFDAEMGSLLVGVTKEYTDLIKDTDGLARVSPKVVKAAEACRKNPMPKIIQEFGKALDDDRAFVMKSVDKKSPEAKAYNAAMDKFVAKWVG